MNQQKIIKLLGKGITKENMGKAVALATAANPAAGLAVSIVGAILVRAVAVAWKYQDGSYQTALIPQVPRHRLTTDESIAFLKDNGLREAFADDIWGANPTNGSAKYTEHDATICTAATFLRKAKDLDDPIFHAFFYGFITHNNLLEIWERRLLYIDFREQLKLASPPAEFTTMSEAIWQEVSGQENREEVAELLKEPAKTYLEGIVSSIDIATIVKSIGIGG
ncbi:MAG: hypothetical protein OCC46_00010 [Pseudodesulfovibrio sp.]